MKVVAFNGSARKDGNTAILINYVLSELRNEGIETELVQLAGKKIHGCIACYKCMENKDKQCAVKDDVANECIRKMIEADGIILGSPTYFSDVTTEMKALIDRAGFVSRMNDFMFKRKVGAAIVAVRRAGATHVFDTINHLFLGSSDDRAGLDLLEHRRRQREGRSGKRRGRHPDHESSWSEYGMAAEKYPEIKARTGVLPGWPCGLKLQKPVPLTFLLCF